MSGERGGGVGQGEGGWVRKVVLGRGREDKGG